MSPFNHHDHEPAAPPRLLPELLDLIATELYRETGTYEHFAACSLVCKDFEASFRPFVFRELEFRRVERFRKFATLLRSNPHIGVYVRVLLICSVWGWKDWEEDFSAVAPRLINLQDVNLLGGRPQNTDIYRRAITCILSCPSIRSMTVFGEIIFDISPRLLLASVEKIEVVACYNPIYNLEYWENLNAAYLNLLDSSAKERLDAPIKWRSLKYCWQSDPTPAWLSYILAVQPTSFANLTVLTLQRAHDSPKVQTVLALAGAGLQVLDISLGLQTRDHSYLPLNLSHNTSLQKLKLDYLSDTSTGYVLRMPQSGLSAIETSLKSVNAPLLRDVHIDIANLLCYGGQSLQQSPHLRRFDACFADFSQRHPGFRHLELFIELKHYPSCKNNINCIQSPLNSPSDNQKAVMGHFPFLTTEKPAHLKVKFSFGLKHRPV